MKWNEEYVQAASNEKLTLEEYVEKQRREYNKTYFPERNPWTEDRLNELKRHLAGIEDYTRGVAPKSIATPNHTTDNTQAGQAEQELIADQTIEQEIAKLRRKNK